LQVPDLIKLSRLFACRSPHSSPQDAKLRGLEAGSGRARIAILRPRRRVHHYANCVVLHADRQHGRHSANKISA
jgi:hypothetical protein